MSAVMEPGEVTKVGTGMQGEAIPSSVAERLTKVSSWYPGHREEVPHGDHQVMGA
jgi:hypothetical protein